MFLYPSELLQIIRCNEVPLPWRRLVVLAVYLGARSGELEALEWGDIDLQHGKVTIHRSIDRDEQDGSTKSVKDKDPRSFGLEPQGRAPPSRDA